MRKILIGLVVIVLLAVGGYWWFEIRGGDSGTDATKDAKQQGIEVVGEFRIVHDACTAFTQEDADTLFETTGSSKSQTVSGASEGENIEVSNCSYSLNTSPGELPSTDFTYVASVISRSAKSASGKESNNASFVSIPEGAEEVQGYGDKAYWVSAYSQLHILKSNNHYILSYGLASVSERTLDDSLLLADIIIEQL